MVVPFRDVKVGAPVPAYCVTTIADAPMLVMGKTLAGTAGLRQLLHRSGASDSTLLAMLCILNEWRGTPWPALSDACEC